MTTLPAAVPVLGTRRVVFVEGGVADPTAVTTGEIASGVDISSYLVGPGWNPTRDQATIDYSPYSTSQNVQVPGRKTASLQLQYTFNLDSAPDDEARSELTEGAEGDFIHFIQKPEDEATYSAGDWYEVWPGRLGQQIVMPSEENQVDRITQNVFVTGPVSDLHQLVVGS